MTTEFIKSPIFQNWFKKNKPLKSLLICSPYFKSYALDKTLEYYGVDYDENNLAIEVLIRGKLEDFISGGSDLSALESLIQIKNLDVEKVRRITNLHMKAYLIDEKKLLIGSANFTQRGLFIKRFNGNVENAIYTDEMEVIDDFKSYYEKVIEESESLEIFYDKIIEEYPKYVNKVSENINRTILSSINKEESKARYSFQEYIEIFEEGMIDADINVSLSVSQASVPQYSNFEDGAYRIVDILTKYNNTGFTYSQLGEIMATKERNDVANKKYGENHANLARLLDFVAITNTMPRRVFLTKLGKVFDKANDKVKIEILKFQIFRMEIIKDIIDKYNNKSFSLLSYLLSIPLAKTTAIRRSSNVKYLFEFLYNNGEKEVKSILDKLRY